jgi:hypothetical protein
LGEFLTISSRTDRGKIERPETGERLGGFVLEPEIVPRGVDEMGIANL